MDDRTSLGDEIFKAAQAWKARAEAAETERDEWKAELDSALAVVGLYQERMFAAERRVAELEAAQAWRPVTEKPERDGRYLIAINYYGRPYTLSALYDHTRDRWQSLNEQMTPTHWRPLPPPPQGDNS